MGFLATPKARSAHSLASRRRISTRSGCSCGSCESYWNAALAWNTVQIGVLINGLKVRGEAVSRKTLARVSRSSTATSSRAELTDFGTNGLA